MRKRVIPSETITKARADAPSLSLEDLAEVEVTSEDPSHPVEDSLLTGRAGWRAAEPGVQTIRLLFDRPQALRRISLEFLELHVERTQEYLLRWSDDGGQSFHDIARQQWNFSPKHAPREIENHRVDLPAVAVLELIITPDISRGNARASLARLQLE